MLCLLCLRFPFFHRWSDILWSEGSFILKIKCLLLSKSFTTFSLFIVSASGFTFVCNEFDFWCHVTSMPYCFTWKLNTLKQEKPVQRVSFDTYFIILLILFYENKTIPMKIASLLKHEHCFQKFLANSTGNFVF